MRVRALTALSGALLIMLSGPMMVAGRPGNSTPQPTSASFARPAFVAVERVIEASDLGLQSPNGITFARESGALLITGTGPDGGSSLLTLSLVGEVQDSIPLPAAVSSTSDVAYDSTRDRLIAVPDGDSIVAVPAAAGRVAEGSAAVVSSVEGHGAAVVPAGVEANPAGEILTLDTDGALRITRTAAPTTARVNRTITLAATGEPLDGLAVAADGHLFSIGTGSGRLYEFDAQGLVIAARGLAGLGIDAPTDLAVAPSGDTNDAPTDMSLYVADAGTADGSGAAVIELALAEAPLAPQALAAATTSVSLVKTTNTGSGSAWNPDSPDPSGLTYIPASETEVPLTRRDRLVAGDGEVDENTGAGFHNVNVWFAPRSGSAQTATFNTNAAPTNPTNNEPVGVAYDPARNELYICNDGTGARVWVYNAATMEQVRVFTVNNAPYNNADSEGLAFASNTLYMVDALDNDLVKVQAGPNGVVGTGNDDIVSNYDLEQYGQREPEGLDVHPESGNIWVVSNRVSQANGPDPMIELTPSGALVSSVSIAAANPNSAGGLAIAPPSDGGGGYNIYIVDRGVDNNDVPSENDGKFYEFSLNGGGGPSAPVAGFGWTQAPGTLGVSFTDTSSGGPTSWSWDFGNGGGTVDSTAQNPSFTYAAPGTYTVTLTATNAAGSDAETLPVTVTDPSAPANLLVNPSFEIDANGNAIPDAWGSNAKFTRSSAIPAPNGSFVGRHLNNNNNIFQQVSVAAGTAYDFSGMVNLPATSDAFTFQLNVQWRGTGGNVGSPVVIHTFADDTAGSWQTRTARLTAPAGANAARVQMKGKSMNASGVAYVDAFSFGAAGTAPPPGAPDTTITAGPSGTVPETSASFSFTGTSGTTSFECQLDGAGFAPCATPTSYSDLAPGSHAFEVRALAGSVADPSPASRAWTISSEPPTPGDNLLTNPGFELDADSNTIPDDWGNKTKFVRSATIAPHSGTYAGRHTAANDSSWQVFQPVAVTGGTQYAFSGWANIPAPSDPTSRFRFRLRWMSGTTTLTTVTIHEFVTSTSGWQHVTSTLTAPATATAAEVIMAVTTLNGSVYVDDLSLSTTP